MYTCKRRNMISDKLLIVFVHLKMRAVFGGVVVFGVVLIFIYTKTLFSAIAHVVTKTKLSKIDRRTQLRTNFDKDWFEWLDTWKLPDNDLTNKTVQERLETRREWLESSCDLVKSRGFLPPNWWTFKDEYLDHFIVNHEKRILYCYLPKVANTNFRRVFLWLQGYIQKEEVLAVSAYDVYKAYSDNLFSLRQYNKKQRQQLLDTYRKFIIVRDPFERLLSAYRDKFTRDNSSESVKWHRKVRLFYNEHTHLKEKEGIKVRTDFQSGHLSFLEYIVYFVHTYEEKAYLNEHFVASNQLCDPCRTKIDYIVKFETMNDDLPYIFRELNIDIEFPGNDYYSSQTNRVVGQYFENVSTKLLIEVWNVLKFDYLLFGFSLPPWFRDRMGKINE